MNCQTVYRSAVLNTDSFCSCLIIDLCDALTDALAYFLSLLSSSGLSGSDSPDRLVSDNCSGTVCTAGYRRRPGRRRCSETGFRKNCKLEISHRADEHRERRRGLLSLYIQKKEVRKISFLEMPLRVMAFPTCSSFL